MHNVIRVENFVYHNKKYLAIYGVSISSSYKYWADGSRTVMVSTDGSSRKTAQNSAETLVSKITEPATWKKVRIKIMSTGCANENLTWLYIRENATKK